MSDLVLSLFPGIGLLDMAFEQEGFCVVRGPDVLWGGDVRRFHPPAGKFDGIIGGPPCQAFSRLRFIVEQNGYQVSPNLIPEYERVVAEAQPTWFLMENVPDAPEPQVADYAVRSICYNNRWAPEAPEQNRVRRFSFGSRGGLELRPEVTLLENPTWEHAVTANGGSRPVPVALIQDGKGGHARKKSALKNLGYCSAEGLRRACRLQGLPEDFLEKAPFTVAGKFRAIGNGVPLPMGRAIARAVRRALEAP